MPTAFPFLFPRLFGVSCVFPIVFGLFTCYVQFRGGMPFFRLYGLLHYVRGYMSSPVVFYIPNLVRAGSTGRIPEQTALLQSGIAEDEAAPSEERMRVREAEALFRARLPLSPREAKAALAEMLRLGREQAGEGSLLHRVLLERLFSESAMRSREETKALEAFAESGRLPDETGRFNNDGANMKQSEAFTWGMADAEAIKAALVDCQKTLLLAQELETRQAEIREVHRHSLQLEGKLLHALHGGEGDELFESLKPHVSDLSSQAESTLPWRAILDAALAFVPEQTVFFTADSLMAEEIRDMGMLQPFPEDRADVCAGWPQELIDGLLFANLPAWRLVGRRFLPAERPWLARDVEVLVARPLGGWGRQTGERDR